MIEYIMCSAIHVKDGKEHVHQPENITSGFVICGRRHHNCYTILDMMGESVSKLMVGREGQGFLTNFDRALLITWQTWVLDNNVYINDLSPS